MRKFLLQRSMLCLFAQQMNRINSFLLSFLLLSASFISGCEPQDSNEATVLLLQSFDATSETEVLVAREKLLQKHPQSPAAAYVRSWLLVRAGNKEGAFKLADSLVQASPKFAIGYYARANYQNSEAWEQSLKDYSKTLELSPDFVPALLNRGSLHFARQKFGEAKADFEKILTKNPNHVEALLNLGNVLFSLNQVDEACENWEVAAAKGNVKAKQLQEVYCK